MKVSIEEIFIQFNYEEAATKRCFYRDHLEILSSASQHQHRHWHQHCKRFIFAFITFFKKIEYLCYFLCLVMVSLPLCYKYLFLYDFLFIHSKASIGVLEKDYLNIRKHPSIGVLKNQLLRKFLHTLHTFQRNIQGGVLFKYTRRPSWDCSKKLFRAAILQTGIYRSNLDVHYSAQKTQSFN